MKRFICAFLALTMAVGLLGGCSGKGSKDSEYNATGLNEEETGEITLENNCYSAGFPIAKDAVKLTALIKDDGGATDYTNLPLNEWMKKNMNVEIEYQVSGGGWDVNNQLALAYASGNMPDLFMGMAPTGYPYHWDYIEDGFITDLTEYIPKYCPNVIKMFKEEPITEYLCRGYDDNIYTLPMSFNYSEDDSGRTAGQLYINQKWLDNLNLSMPKTTEDFKKVLRAFKSSDPNGNGIADEIPLCIAEELPNGLYGAFGMPVYFDLAYIDKAHKVHYAPIENDYRRCLTYYRDLIKEGLINSDFYTLTHKDLIEKANTSIAQVGCFVNDGSTGILKDDRAADYAAVPPLTDELGNCTWTNQEVESVWPEWFMITSSCKYPEVALRVADYFYSTEGSFVAMYGEPGVLWEVEDDGKVHFKNPDMLNTDRYKQTPSYPMPHFFSEKYKNLIYTETDHSKMSQHEIIIERDEKWVKEYYMPAFPENARVKFKTMYNDLSELNAYDFDQYTWRKKFLLGDASLENEWDTYISNAKRAGVDDYVAILQRGYDDYRSWLAQ